MQSLTYRESSDRTDVHARTRDRVPAVDLRDGNFVIGTLVAGLIAAALWGGVAAVVWRLMV